MPRDCRLLAKVGRHLDVLPGEEFRVALREAHAIGAQVREDACVRPAPPCLALLAGQRALSCWGRPAPSAERPACTRVTRCARSLC